MTWIDSPKRSCVEGPRSRLEGQTGTFESLNLEVEDECTPKLDIDSHVNE